MSFLLCCLATSDAVKGTNRAEPTCTFHTNFNQSWTQSVQFTKISAYKIQQKFVQWGQNYSTWPDV